ncbi:DHH family phosphoesterase [Helicobacter sp. 23-1045]
MTEIHHLSHIDLDGYGAQFVAREFFKNIVFYNANYGREVEVRLRDMLGNIKSAKNTSFLILITDLNLTLNEAKFLQSEVALLNAQGKKTQLLLLDHHITGKECAQVYEWYHLDSSICASKITLNFLSENIANLCAKSAESCVILRDSHKREGMQKFIDMIDSADTWKEDGFGFEFGKVALGMIAQSREFSRYMFDDFDRDFKFKMLEVAKNYLLDSQNNPRPNANVALDNNIFLDKKKALGGDLERQTMEQILSQKQTDILRSQKEKYTIFLNDANGDKKRGILTYGIGNISILANLFLTQNSEFDFFLDIGSGGTVSFRANGNCDVSAVAKKYFNGGGHKNAAGGKIEEFKGTFLYDEARAQLEARIGNSVEDDDDDWQRL